MLIQDLSPGSPTTIDYRLVSEFHHFSSKGFHHPKGTIIFEMVAAASRVYLFGMIIES